MTKNIKGIIFDMDGTMIDNMMIHHEAWQEKLAELGLVMDLEEVRKSIHGINQEILKRLFGDRFTDEDRHRISAEKEAAYRRIFLPTLKLIDGLPQFFSEIQQVGMPMAIGTAAPPENVDFVLDNLGLRPLFGAVFHSKSVSKGKPDPEIFIKAANGIGLNPDECIVFEDSPTGVEAAFRAGSPTVVVTTTHPPEEFAQFSHILKFISNYNALNLKDLI